VFGIGATKKSDVPGGGRRARKECLSRGGSAARIGENLELVVVAYASNDSSSVIGVLDLDGESVLNE